MRRIDWQVLTILAAATIMKSLALTPDILVDEPATQFDLHLLVLVLVLRLTVPAQPQPVYGVLWALVTSTAVFRGGCAYHRCSCCWWRYAYAWECSVNGNCVSSLQCELSSFLHPDCSNSRR
jgi:hypothetical protein